MNNKILSPLPMKKGIGSNYNKTIVDWNLLVDKIVQVEYEGGKYELYIKSYNKETKYLEVAQYKRTNKYFEWDFIYIHCSEIKKGIFTKILKKKFYEWIEENKEWYSLEIDYETNLKKLQLDKIKINQLTIGSGVKVFMKCTKCGSIQNVTKSPATVIREHIGCCCCGDGVSYPNKFITNILRQLNIYYETEKSFNEINKKYDFYIPSISCILEAHGQQHYERGFSSCGGRSLKEEQENDKIKEQLAKENGIKHYIVIDCRKSELEFIKNNILNSQLSNLFNLSKINWQECNKYACSSLVLESAELYNKNISLTDISNILNVAVGTTIRYLHQAKSSGLCNYKTKFEEDTELIEIISNLYNNNISIKDISKQTCLDTSTIRKYLKIGALRNICSYDSNKAKEESILKSLSICREKNSKKIICINTLKIYNTISEAGIHNNINYKNISLNCRGSRNCCGKDACNNKLIWLYYDDYLYIYNNITNDIIGNWKIVREYLKNKYNKEILK